jgi:hypothetical protein
MTQILLPALITGLCTLLAAIIAKSDLMFMVRRRKRHISGTWTGRGSEEVLRTTSTRLTYEATFQFRQIGSRITGHVHALSSSGEHYLSTLKGQMEDDHFVTLIIRSSRPQVFNFGVVVLELDAKGKQLNGYALANGLSAHGIALSEITLNKDPV